MFDGGARRLLANALPAIERGATAEHDGQRCDGNGCGETRFVGHDTHRRLHSMLDAATRVVGLRIVMRPGLVTTPWMVRFDWILSTSTRSPSVPDSSA